MITLIAFIYLFGTVSNYTECDLVPINSMSFKDLQ